MKKVASFIDKGYLCGDRNQKIEVHVDKDCVYHLCREKKVFKAFTPSMKTFPMWENVTIDTVFCEIIIKDIL